MSSSFTIPVTVNIPVEIYQALWAANRKSDIKVECDAAAKAIFEEIRQNGPGGYQKITIDDFRNTYDIWVGTESYPEDVFAELERVHGIKRDDRVLTYGGEEIGEGSLTDEVCYLQLLQAIDELR